MQKSCFLLQRNNQAIQGYMQKSCFLLQGKKPSNPGLYAKVMLSSTRKKPCNPGVDAKVMRLVHPNNQERWKIRPWKFSSNCCFRLVAAAAANCHYPHPSFPFCWRYFHVGSILVRAGLWFMCHLLVPFLYKVFVCLVAGASRQSYI